MTRIVLIGAGNLATNLALNLYQPSINIVQVYSRTIQSANLLAQQVAAEAITDLNQLVSDADVYIFAVKDAALADLITQTPFNKGLWVHTAGSIPMDIFEHKNVRYGVLYPFQTFSKGRRVSFRTIPIFLETSNKDDLLELQSLSKLLSDNVLYLSSDKRQYLHLTGVLACNFVNHLYALSNDILQKENIPFDCLLPLIDETVSKVHQIMPDDAQTGPAVRFDENVMNKHLSLIEDTKLKTIYKLMSESIYLRTQNNNK